MLSSIQQREVLYLLAQGRSDAEVARLTGVSRNAVRRLHKLQRVQNRYHPTHNCQEGVEVCFSYLLQVETGKEGRCPTCGEKVSFPCHSCLLAQYSKVRPGAPITDDFSRLAEIQKELDSIEETDPDEDPDEDQDEGDQGEDDATSQD